MVERSRTAPRPTRCAFSWIECSSTRIVIRDLDMPGKPSVTNDADRLVANFLALGLLMPGVTRLFYFDTMDVFDEIVYDATGFLRFAPVPEEQRP